MSSKSISPSELAKRYAVALLQEAIEKKEVAGTVDEMTEFKKLIDENQEFYLLLTSPVISKEDRLETMQLLVEKAGVSDIMRRFFGVLSENDRLNLFPQICEQFSKAYDAFDGYIDVSVSCAMEPQKDVLEKLTETLKKVYDKKIRLNVSVDASLLGGLTVRVGSVLVDGSLKSKLQKLNQVMKGIGL